MRKIEVVSVEMENQEHCILPKLEGGEPVKFE